MVAGPAMIACGKEDAPQIGSATARGEMDWDFVVNRNGGAFAHTQASTQPPAICAIPARHDPCNSSDCVRGREVRSDKPVGASV